MKKILATLAIATAVCFHAEAQNAQKKPVAATSNKPAAKTTAKKHKAKHKEEVQQNFAICRSNSGYAICGEAPTEYNSTRSIIKIREEKPIPMAGMHGNTFNGVVAPYKPSTTGPSNQSYPENTNYVSGICDYPYEVPHVIVVGPFSN